MIMKICVFSRISRAHSVKGGMEGHGEALSQGLAKRGHQLFIITTSHPRGVDQEHSQGVHIYYTRAPARRYTRQWWQESIDRFEALHSDLKFDLVWSQSAGGDSYAENLKERCGVPLVSILHGTFLGEARTALRQLSPRIEAFYSLARVGRVCYHHLRRKSFIRFADAIIAVSEELKRDISRIYAVDPQKIFVVPNGIDVEVFAPSRDHGHAIRRKYGVANGTRVLMTVGRLESDKGVQIAIQVLERLTTRFDVRLMIVGQGKYQSELQSLAARQGLASKVTFCGFVSREGLPAFYNACDVFLMPTLREEGLPFVLVEAMACGLPVIATNIGGIPTVIDDGENGLLFPPGDTQALTALVKRLLDEAGLAEALGKAARVKAVERFSVERMVHDTLAVFDGVMARHRRGCSFPPYGHD